MKSFIISLLLFPLPGVCHGPSTMTPGRGRGAAWSSARCCSTDSSGSREEHGSVNTGRAAAAGGETSQPRGHCLNNKKHRKEKESFELKRKANKTITRILSHASYLLLLSTIFICHALRELSYKPLMQTNFKNISFSINDTSRAFPRSTNRA